MIDPAKLKEIEGRCSAASAGPWCQDIGRDDESMCHVYEEAGEEGHRSFDTIALTLSPKDAEFIAHARQDIPALLTELRELRARCEDLCESLRYAANFVLHDMVIQAAGRRCSQTCPACVMDKALGAADAALQAAKGGAPPSERQEP